jgi:hypothetical protein
MDKRVEAAIRPLAIEWGDRPAQRAVAALDAMTDTGRPEEVTQWRVQQFCWEVLPNATSISRNDRLLAALALASLLARFDLRRYAEIAGGRRTRSLIEGSAPGPFERSDWRGRSPRESGITPADTELLSWLADAGPAEQAAYERVANALELASATGELDPGQPGSGTVRHRVTQAVLETPLAELGGRSPVEVVLTERFVAWAGTGSPRGDLLGPLEPDLTRPTPLVEGSAAERLVPAEVSWLVDACLGGVRLTSSGNLPGPVVRAYLAEFGSGELRSGRTPRESNVPSLAFFRAAAERSQLLLRQGGSLVTSGQAMTAAWGRASGRRLPTIAELLARSWVGADGDLRCEVGELVCGALLTGPVEAGHLARWIEATSAHRRWGEARGVPLPPGAVESLTRTALTAAERFDLVARSVPEGYLVLSGAGRSFLLEALRQRLIRGDPGFRMSVELPWPETG